MRSCILLSLGLLGSALAQTTSVDTYVATESPIAKAGLLANIGPNGSKSSGAKAGVVIASPSTSNPNYLYTWVRDSSLVFKVLVDQYTAGTDTSLRGLIDDFVTAEATLQQVTNPSGSVDTGGLGEPKFNIDETAFTDPWGRPHVTLWPIIQLDLNYVANFWNQSTFDLWEEVDSSSFWTTAVQHRSLREGSSLATRIGQTSSVASYKAQADNLLCFLQTYWNPSGHYITANTGGGRSGIDSNTVLASIHTFDPAAGCDASTFQPCSDKALSNLKAYVDSFRSIYSINNGIASNGAVATGRYPEDVYQGGNPWYLSTMAVAEQLYDALYVWDTQDSLTVTPISLPFFQLFDSAIQSGTYSSSSSAFTTLTSAIRTFADGFIAIHAKYTPSGGALAEQFTKSNGAPTSAVDLTWSYAAALTGFAARSATNVASWGAAGLTVPAVCNSNSGPTVSVTFNVDATTVLGENIYITGSVDALSNWSPDSALELSPASYPTWSST
ncbi:hypothetical protein EW026_g1770 [Hermanssonia centrifuga]|uniref:glucan 1,4-alpha-glucosidase n=1 Tax=Hermanssonia centrifuga TaxID=98765 RepID=A0A4S4KQD4_9APHY|nr:hypothetical protein EW026_g1770 [Hermanssonia centrifuga]